MNFLWTQPKWIDKKINVEEGLKQFGENTMKKTQCSHSNNDSICRKEIQITSELSSQLEDQTHNDPPPRPQQ